jgi:hypothetical protein
MMNSQRRSCSGSGRKFKHQSRSLLRANKKPLARSGIAEWLQLDRIAGRIIEDIPRPLPHFTAIVANERW